MCNICIAWDNDIPVNIAAILLDEKGYVSDSKDIIFPNQSNTNRGIKMAGEPLFSNDKTNTNELFFIDFNLLPTAITEIKFILYSEEFLNQIKKLQITISDENQNPISTINIDISLENIHCFELFSLVFKNGVWETNEKGKPYKQSFNSLLSDYFQL